MGCHKQEVCALVIPNSPGLIVVEVDIPFSVGLWEEGMGQDTSRAIKWQVVPMPVPGEVNHDVSAAFMHFSKSEWCHLAPQLQGLCHRPLHLLPHQLPWVPKDPGGRRRSLGLTQGRVSP